MKVLNYTFLILFSFFFSIKASEISFDNWLILGPIKTPNKNIEQTLKPNYFDIEKLKPVLGIEYNIKGNKIKWQESNKFTNYKSGDLLYRGTYFTNNGFAKIKFSLITNNQFELFVNGQKQIFEYNKKENKTPYEFSLFLESGKHTILIKSIMPDSAVNFTLKAVPDSNSKNITISFTNNPTRYVTFNDLLDNPKVKSISVSPEGKYAIINLTERNKSKNGNDSYFRLFDLKENKEIMSYRGLLDLSSFQFSNVDNIAAYTKTDKNGTNLFIADLKNGTSRLLLSEIKNFDSFYWAQDGKFIIYSIKIDRPSKTIGLKKYENMTDRYPWSNSYNLLYFVDVESGFTNQLTFGDEGTDFNSISPNSTHLIYSTTKFISDKRPYSKTNYYLLNIETLKSDSLFSMYRGGTAIFSPDGNKIAITGGPTEFNNLGLNLPNNMIANDYDTQLYIYNIITKNIQACSKDFNPSISSVFWTDNNTLYVNTTDKTEEHIYKYNIAKNTYTYINLGVSTIGSIDFDKNGTTVVYSGAKVN
ncbi:MAG TPA: hypothetical protein PL041_12055, partial [Melioribacteraceae bacterium]|nr:hypothetical protein [Melioribacteraceae bacterium]